VSSAPSVPEPRTHRARCRRPSVVCYCAALPRLETRTKIVILQHTRERDMPIGTARMASLCLPQAKLHVGVRWDESVPLARALADATHPPILLYPGEGAKDILREPPAGPVTLVVVDGTWSQAKSVVRDNPVLQALPRYAFSAPELSQYRIRKEPRDEYVSTIEALMFVLGALEGEPERFRALLDPLNAMVDLQLAHQAAHPRARPRHPRPAKPPRVPFPAAVMDRYDDLLCLVGEANAWPFEAAGATIHDELVHAVAHRPGTGETFAMIAAPESGLSPTTCFHIGLEEHELLGGARRADVLAQLAAFTRPTDIVCTWGHYGTSLVADGGGTLPAERFDLRAAAQRFANVKIGSLDDYAASLGPIPSPVTGGRAGQRLAMLTHIVQTWCERQLALTP
jgi:DTW domain-containing protein YfiP